MNPHITKILIILLVNINFSFSQIAVGQWRDHMPYTNTNRVAEGNNMIYCSTDNGIFYYNKADNSINKLTKVQGLSDIGITCMGFDKSSNTLFVGYSNGNIDLVNNNSIFNISDIKRRLISGDKKINNVYFLNNSAYISTAFGIVVIDLTRKEIKETYLIGALGTTLNINDITSDENFIYAATNNGIYKGDYKNNINLSDYNNWIKLTFIPNFESTFNAITSFNNIIYASYDDINNKDTIYVIDGNNWSYFDNLQHNVSSIYSDSKKLIICNSNFIQIFDNNLNSIENIWSYNLNPLKVKYAIFDQSNQLWIADRNNGLVKKTNSGFEKFIPNGPSNANVVSISIQGQSLWAIPGGKDGSWTQLDPSMPADFHTFKNEFWQTLNNSNVNGIPNVKNIVKVIVNPSNPSQVFAASWGYGLLEFNNKNFVTQYKDNNSSIQTIFAGQNYYRVFGLAFDNANNLWLTNSEVSNAVSVKTFDNKWYGLKYYSLINTASIGDIIVTQSNNKWAVLPRGVGLFAFNEKGTFENIDDDDTKKFLVLDENNQIITNDIFSIAEDVEGHIWIGTNKGIVVYYNPENVFSGQNFYAQRIIIPSSVEGQASYLLENETVTAIVIDGANQKWIGTEMSGAFLLSADGTKEIHHFTAENSPLLSNNVSTIAIDGITGEVYFGTDKGIISFRGTATEGSENNEQVYVFPNPVRENYTGLITITGLVTNSNVKITDISGGLVYETTTEGGQATWNGKNFEGRKVNTGVYLVFSSNKDGTKTNISKILFIN